MSTPTPDGAPTRADFRRELLAALREAGIEGPFEHDDQNDRLLHAGQGSLDLREAYDSLAGAPTAKRAEVLAGIVRTLAAGARLPQTWAEASTVVKLAVKSRIAVQADDVRRDRGAKSSPVPRSDVTPHLLLEVVVPVSKAQQVLVSMDLLGLWGIGPDAACHAGAANLAKASANGWGMIAEAPGVFFSGWNDGFDAARIALPRLFAVAPLKGRPVVLAASPSALAFTGSDDEEGLFHLARLTKRLFEQSHRFLFLRALRMGADGESWEDWMPPRDHGAYDEFRLLQAINEASDYEEQVRIIHRAAEGKGTPMPLPKLEIVQQLIGGASMALTRWEAGPACALPKADAIVFVRQGEVLGIASWEDVVSKLPGVLDPLPGYPVRFLASSFPEDWQLAALDLKRWGPPPPA